MDKEVMEKKIQSRIRQLLEKLKKEDVPDQLIKVLEEADYIIFTPRNKGMRDDLRAGFPEWSEELQEMYDDIDHYVEEHDIWLQKQTWYEKF